MNNAEQVAEATRCKTSIEMEVAAMAEGMLVYSVDLAAQTSKRLNDVNAWLRRLS